MSDFSLSMHTEIAQRLSLAVIEKARQRLEWADARGTTHREYIAAWRTVLDLDIAQVGARLTERSEAMDMLRQCSPFVGVLTAQERWAIFRRTKAA